MSDQQSSSSQQSKNDELFQSLFRVATMSCREDITPRTVTGSVPLSASQQQMWFLHQLCPESPVYNTFRAFYLTGPLNIEVMKSCLKEIICRHEILRSTFRIVDGQPVQIVQPNMGFEFSFKKIAGIKNHLGSAIAKSDFVSYESLSPEVEAFMRTETQKTFNLSDGPCLRVALFKVNEDRFYFLLVMPHIVCDGWSLSIFFQELSILYESFLAGLPSPLPKLPIQFSDYAAWQQKWLQNENLKIHTSYWQKQLSEYPKSLNFPSDFSRPATQKFYGASEPIFFSKDATEALKAFSFREGATLFMTLLAAFKVLLFRYSGQTDIIVGSPIAKRNQVEIQGLIGCFINTLALRTNFSGSLTFQELLARVKQTALDAYAHQDLPFPTLVGKLVSKRELSSAPLFQVAFTLQNTPDLVQQFGGLTFKSINIDNGTAKSDLSFILEEKNEGLRGKLEYSTDLFQAETIKRLINHFHILLNGIVANPDQLIARLPLMPKMEQEQILVKWNETRVDYTKNKCIHELVELQVESTPAAVAVVFDDQRLCYSELNERANQLAHFLIDQGAEPGDLVGICLERSIEMVIGVLATLKAGCAYVPLDPSYPKERLAFIMSDTQVSVILTQEKLKNLAFNQKTRVIPLDSVWRSMSFESGENIKNRANPDHPAYIIYTSGSTGLPKGVVISHHAISNHMQWMQRVFPINSSDAVLQKTPFSFDASIWEFYAPLIAGGKLIIAKPEGHADVNYIVNTTIDQNVTILQFVPSVLQLMLDDPRFATCKSLRRVFCGGETLTAQLVNRFSKMLPWATLHNLYGPTETTIDVLSWNCPQKKRKSIIPIGKPIDNVKVYIVDKLLQPVPVGVRGELLIGGDCLSLGYLNRPKLTSEKFIPDPFSRVNGARLYKTGDLVRYLPDGNIEFLGRLDHQVKIRGYRIELGEIESVLSRHIGVKEAIVIAREDSPGDKRLVAYVVVKDKPNISLDDLRNFLKEKLPGYLLPSAFMILERFPLTANGKTDRGALPPPSNSPVQRDDRSDGKETPFQEEVRKIWQDILHKDHVGIHDDFFELGGHSLLAMQIISRVRRDFQVELSIHDVFEFTTVAGIAKVIDQKIISPVLKTRRGNFLEN